MRRVYILLYNMLAGNREKIKDWADASSLVLTWRYDLPSCIYLVSDASAAELAADFERANGKRGRFLFVEVSDNRQGRLPVETWHLFRNKELKTSG